MASAREREIEKRGIGIGMVIAAAIIADHDPVYAEEILGAAGLTTTAAMRAEGCEPYDILKLKRVVQHIAQRRANTARHHGYGFGAVEKAAA